MLPRFYAPNAGEGAEPIVTLPEEESAHLLRVLRLRPGDAVRVFDGRGGEWEGEVAERTKRTAAVRLLQRITAVAEPRVSIALALAVLKGGKMDDIVRDAVMLGVSEIVPLVTERSEISPSAIVRGRRTERWQRIAIASAKQCGRAVVPRIADVAAFADWIAQPLPAPLIVLVEPAANVARVQIERVTRQEHVIIAIGPEGGWTDREVAAAVKAGATPVTIGTLTLRADAAPVVALTAFRTVWEDL